MVRIQCGSSELGHSSLEQFETSFLQLVRCWNNVFSATVLRFSAWQKYKVQFTNISPDLNAFIGLDQLEECLLYNPSQLFVYHFYAGQRHGNMDNMDDK